MPLQRKPRMRLNDSEDQYSLLFLEITQLGINTTNDPTEALSIQNTCALGLQKTKKAEKKQDSERRKIPVLINTYLF